MQTTSSPVNVPPSFIYRVIYRVRLHLVQSSRSSNSSPVPILSCSQGTCRHSVFKKVHLTFSSSLQTILEAVNSSCINIILRQAVPVVDHSLRKEVKTTVTATTFFHQFPRVTPSNRIFGSFEESIPRNRRQLLHHLKNFNEICSVSPLLERPQS